MTADSDIAAGYSRRQSRWMLLALLVEAAFLLVLPHAGYRLSDAIGHIDTQRAWTVLASAGAAAAAAYVILLAPISRHRHYTLRRRFGLLEDSADARPLVSAIGRVSMRLALGVFILAAGVASQMLPLQYQPLGWAGLPMLAMLVLIPLSRRRRRLLAWRVKPMPPGECHDELSAFAREHGADGLRLYLLESAQYDRLAQAAYTGRRGRPTVFLSENLPDMLDRRQLKSIFAHELGHWRYNHSLWSVIVQLSIVTGAVAVASLTFSRLVWQYQPAQLAFALPTAMLAAYVVIALSQPAALAVSRHQEYRANAWALEATQDPQAFVSAMDKLSANNLIAGRQSWWLTLLFSSHPSVDDMIDQARRFAARKATKQ